jgi:hypothetical protein
LLKLPNRLVEAVCDTDFCTGFAHPSQGGELRRADLSAFGFDFESVDATVVDRDDVRQAGGHSEALQDARLNLRSKTAVRRMESEYTGRAARA